MADRSPGSYVAAGGNPAWDVKSAGVISPINPAASPVWTPADITDDPAMFGVAGSSAPASPTTGQLWPRGL